MKSKLIKFVLMVVAMLTLAGATVVPASAASVVIKVGHGRYYHNHHYYAHRYYRHGHVYYR